MDYEQALKVYTQAENDLQSIRKKYREVPERLKDCEPVAVFNLKLAELVLEKTKKECQLI